MAGLRAGETSVAYATDFGEDGSENVRRVRKTSHKFRSSARPSRIQSQVGSDGSREADRGTSARLRCRACNAQGSPDQCVSLPRLLGPAGYGIR
jgi:hypothetical protein